MPAEVDHAWTSAASGASGVVGLARDDVVEVELDAGHDRPGEDLGQRRRDRIDRIPVDRQPDLDVLGLGSSRPARRGPGRPSTAIATAPEVKPAPNATITIRSPTLTRPESTASASAIGIDAAEVFP